MRPRPILAVGLLAALLLAPAAALAQASPSPFTSGTRYDAMGRVTGTISADPDGPSGPLPFRATRNSYDGAGRLVKVETGTLAAWQSEAVAPSTWTGFAVERTLETAYDAMGRKVRDTLREGAAGAVRTVTQHSYNSLGRPDCTALRMNPAAFAALPALACTPGPAGADGPDRITRNVYDAAGQRLQLREGVGSGDEAAEATWAYNLNGQVTAVIDGNGNRAELRYDGHGRQDRWTFPSTARPPAYDDSTAASALATAGAADPDNFEGYGYDPNGNRTSLRLRSGETVAYSYDALNRMTLLDNPLSGTSVTDTDISYSYDLLGLRTQAIDNNGHFVRNGYDGLGRLISEESLNGGTKTMQYDAAGRRSRLTWADGFAVGYAYYDTGEVREIRENPQGANLLLAAFGYDAMGRRTSLTRGNGRVTVYGYDAVSRLAYLGHHIGTFEPFSYFSYNAASQIASLTRTSDAMAFTAFANAARADTINGLNQIANGGVLHDPRGNMTSDGAVSFAYNLRNQLVARAGVTQLYHDPSGRLTQQWNGGGVLDWVGDALVGESGGSNPRRYVHGPGVDEPILWYENGARRYLHADERGSVVAVTDDAGALLAINRYDEYGVPAATNIGRFQYTGQAWLPEIGRYYYKARIYWADGGRFMQTDPVGYEDQFNLYAYVGNDPLNHTDPSGEDSACIYAPSGCDYGANFTNVINAFEGVGSYFRHIPVSLRYVIDSSGLSGVEAQNRSALVGQLAGRAFNYIGNHRREVAGRALRLMSNNRAFVGGRVAAGGAVSYGGGPAFGGSMTALSIIGGAINAINGVVSQLEAGNIGTQSLLNQTLGTIAAAGILGASVRFDARTGDITASMTTQETGSRITQTRTEVICNVNSRDGC